MCLRAHILVYACVAAGLSSEMTLSDKYTPANYLRTRLNYVHSEEAREGGDVCREEPQLV